MKVNTVFFWIIGIFFALSAATYVVWAYFYYGSWDKIEWVGAVALTLSAILAIFIAFYLGKTAKAVGGVLPEDRLDANIDDGDPEMGHFSPWSWWPVTLGFSISLVALGLAVGFWVAFIGGAVAIVALIGWVYEYYRHYFAR